MQSRDGIFPDHDLQLKSLCECAPVRDLYHRVLVMFITELGVHHPLLHN